jgi:hypothetical protein
MKRAVVILCFAGAAAVWAWALAWPKEAVFRPLPERFVGEFQVAGIETPPGMPSPLPPGKQYVFRFAADGTYTFSIYLNAGYEILRQEGVVEVSDSGVVTFKRVSSNRREDRGEPERYHAEWGKDEKGPFLALRHVTANYTYRLRP